MRVVFLDIDGVLNSRQFADRVRREEGVDIFAEDILDKKALLLLRQLVTETGAQIVLSSSWRHIPPAREAAAHQLECFGMRIHSDTPYRGGIRGEDITAWFKRHPECQVTSYVILDDDSDMGEHAEHLVKTTFKHGLQRTHYEQALTILQGGST